MHFSISKQILCLFLEAHHIILPLDFRVEDVILPQDRAIRASKFRSSICFMPDGSVYGIAGDEMDIALLFRWDGKRGLRFLGHMGQGYGESIDDVFYCTYATTCAVSPDGKYLAVGATERLSTVVLYRL